MTVGITINGRTQAVVLSDAQVSDNGRTSNKATKMGSVKGEQFHGVMYGTGSGNTILGGNIYGSSHRPEGSDGSLNELLGGLHNHIEQYVLRSRKAAIKHQLETARVHATVFKDEETKKQFLLSEESRILREANEHEQKDRNETLFAIAAYDRTVQRVRTHYLTSFISQEIFLDTILIGSGQDAAQIELDRRTQGVSIPNLPMTKLLYLAMTGYISSTVNQGVGGTPSVALIDSIGVRSLSASQVITAANLATHHLADPSQTTGKTIMSIYEKLLENPEEAIALTAKHLGLPERFISEVTISYQSVQEAVNRDLFK